MPAPLAMALLQFVPEIVGLFSSDKKAKVQKTVTVVEHLAKSITGQSGDAAVKALSEDPDLAFKFKTAVLADSHVDEEMRYADRHSAREMYKVHNAASDRIAGHIMKYNLWVVFLLVATNILAMIYVPDPIIVGTLGTTVGFVINALLKERQDVTGFHFGSSTGSKLKDANNG